MGNLFYGLNIAKNALDAQSSALNVTAHNIANANTPGYSRQQAQLTAISDFSVGGLRMGSIMKIGSGVEAKQISRSRFALYDEVYRKENQDLNFNVKTEGLLNQIEILFDEPSDRSLGGIMNDFFNGWLDIANTPKNTAARQSLYSIAQEMTDRFKRIYDALIILHEDIDTELSAIPKQINEISSEIADLNVAIRKSEGQGGIANDLRDKLDKLIDDLSTYTDVKTVNQKDGTTTVLVGPKVIVERDTHIELSITTTSEGEMGLKKTAIVSKDGAEFIPQHGQLGALINFRDNILNDLMDGLNKLTESIVTTINFDHRIGYGLDGLNGRNFFEPNKIKAYNIEVSKDIEDVSHIAASGDGTVGDNTNALSINELKERKVVDNSYTIQEFYNGYIVNLGVMAREAKSGRMNQELLVTQIDNSRESIKGVNIDEELVNMIKFQYVYQSAARMIVILDQLLEEIVNLK